MRVMTVLISLFALAQAAAADVEQKSTGFFLERCLAPLMAYEDFPLEGMTRIKYDEIDLGETGLTSTRSRYRLQGSGLELGVMLAGPLRACGVDLPNDADVSADALAAVTAAAGAEWGEICTFDIPQAQRGYRQALLRTQRGVPIAINLAPGTDRVLLMAWEVEPQVALDPCGSGRG